MKTDPLRIESALASALPPNRRPTPPRAPDNPDDMPVTSIDHQAPRDPNDTPKLMDKDRHTVTPLDLAQAAELVNSRRHLWEGADADEEPFTDVPTFTTVRSSRKKFTFDGVRLALVSSERPEKNRWTDIEIYRTNGGLYVVHTVGVSTIAHAYDPTNPCRWLTIRKYTTGIDGIAADETPLEDRSPCPDCKPNLDTLRHTDPASLLFERDVHNASIHETPESAIQSLFTVRAGERTLGPLAVNALQIAADRDPVMASVYYGARPVPPLTTE